MPESRSAGRATAIRSATETRRDRVADRGGAPRTRPWLTSPGGGDRPTEVRYLWASVAAQNDSASAPEPPVPPRGAGRRFSRWKLLAAALLGPALALTAAYGGDRALHRARVLRNVTLLGADLSGLTLEQAEQVAEVLRRDLRARKLRVRIRDREHDVVAGDLGFDFFPNVAAGAAMMAGRTGNTLDQLSSWGRRFLRPHPIGIEPWLDPASTDVFLARSERRSLEDLPSPGRIRVERGAPVLEGSRPGSALDRAAAASLMLRELAAGGTGPVALPIERRAPPIGEEEIERTLQQARSLLSGPVELDTEEGPVELGDDDLAAALRSRFVAEPSPRLELYFHPIAIGRALDAVRDRIERLALDAAFETDPAGEVTVRPSRLGTRLHTERTAAEVLAAALRESRRGRIITEETREPQLTTEKALELDIRSLVARYTTRHACCQPRVDNIHRIAEMVDGTLLAPGEVFSLNARVGRRTAASGFVDAPGIERGEMVDTVGGGVSQFATTLFNAVFDGGYEIIQRQPHSYYFPRYPMGHDATVSFPTPDLIFRNDTEAGMLIRAEYGPKHIRISIYGDNGGRTVERLVSEPLDVTQPPIEYVPNPAIAPGSSRRLSRGEIGWSVIASRLLTLPDGTTREERRRVTYSPRSRRVEVHPCDIPKGAKGHTGEQCPKPAGPDAGLDPQESPAEEEAAERLAGGGLVKAP